MGHVLTLDMALSFFLALTVLAFVLAQRDGVAAAQSRRWMLAGWAAMALAVLSKGLVGAVLPMAGVALYVLVQRDWGMLRRLNIVPGGALFLAIAAPWFVAVSLANHEFFRFFFVHEHFERYLTRVHGRYQPFWYFVPVLVVGVVPWVVSLFPALVGAWADSPQRRFRPERFLLLWCSAVFVFFSASNSKLAGYILPLLPAAALLIGAELARTPRALLAVQAVAAATAGAAMFAFSPDAVRFAHGGLPAPLLQDYARWLGAAGAVLCTGALAAAVLAWTRRRTASIAALAFSGLATVQIAVSGYETLSPAISAYDIVERIRPQMKTDAPFYFVDTFDHTLLFYLGRTVTMVQYRDELSAAIDWEPHRFIFDVDAFARAWRSDRDAYAMFSAADYARLRPTLDLPMQVIASDPRRIIVRKP
jgi:4-amino-4-deoxy-L-arabinose transferase-like glycosyltransferase